MKNQDGIRLILDKAKKAFDEDNISSAKSILNAAIHSLKEEESHSLFMLYQNLGFYHNISEEYHKAEQAFLKAISLCEIDSEICIAYHALGWTYSDQEKYTEALIQFENAANHSSSPLISFDSHYQIADILLEQYDYSNAAKHRENALLYTENNEMSEEHYMNCVRHLGKTYAILGESSKSVAILEQGLQKSIELGMRDWEKLFVGNLSTAYLDAGQRDKGEEFALKLLEIANKSNVIDDKTTAYNNLALICKERGDYTKGIEWMQKAIEIEENLHSQEIQLRNMSTFYEDVGDLTSALFYSLEAHNTAKQTGNLISIVKSGVQLANLYFEKENHHEAIKYLEDCLKQIGSNPLETFIIEILTQLGSCHSRLDSIEQALEY